MEREQYRPFMAHLFKKYIGPRLARGTRWRHHPMHLEESAWELERLQRALQLIDALERTCEDTDDIYDTFKAEKLKNAVSSITGGVHTSERMLNDTGFLDVLESYFDEIVAGMEVGDFPEEDVLLFRGIRPDYGREDIHEIVVVLKQRRSKLAKREQSIPGELQRVRTELERQSKRLDELETNANKKVDSRPKRKWFKAVGHIGEGALLTIGDISLALGVLPVHASAETASWGVIVSATAGVGKIFDGFGELCGE